MLALSVTDNQELKAAIIPAAVADTSTEFQNVRGGRQRESQLNKFTLLKFTGNHGSHPRFAYIRYSPPKIEPPSRTKYCEVDSAIKAIPTALAVRCAHLWSL
jgi:hypothetical protein